MLVFACNGHRDASGPRGGFLYFFFFRQHLSFALHEAFASEAKVENMASLLSADAIGFDLAGRLKTDSFENEAIRCICRELFGELDLP